MSAFILIEEKTIWFWQVPRFVRDGWNTTNKRVGWFRIHLERCVG